MKRHLPLLYVLAGAALLFIPTAAYAAGLVPCSGIKCNLCDLGVLAQNIINFLLIGVVIPLAALMFAYAGVLYFTGGSNMNKIARAHKIFKDVLIGFLIAISAWLVINTVITVIFTDDFFRSGDWFVLQCVSETTNRPGQPGRLINTNIGQLFKDFVPGVDAPEYTPPPPSTDGATVYETEDGGHIACPGGSVYNPEKKNCINTTTNSPVAPLPTGDNGSVVCPTNSFYDPERRSCINKKTNTPVASVPTGGGGGSGGGGVGPGSRGRAICLDSNTNCSVPVLQAAGFTPTQALTMSCIAVTEGSGNSGLCSGTGPCGTFQITRDNWRTYAPADCSAANFGGDIRNAQNNAQCNIRTAVNLVRVNGYQPWTGLCNTRGGCNVGTKHAIPYGAPWNPAARTCVKNYDPTNLK